MAVQLVTFSVQLGSGGNEIARAVSQTLGYRYYDREIISAAAERVGVSPETVANAERWPSFMERLLEHLGKANEISEVALPGASGTTSPVLTMTSADYRGLIEQVVQELGRRGQCVIVGHAGQVLLREVPGIFRAFTHGSVPRRAERLAGEIGVAKDEALRRVHADDRDRIEFFRHVYEIDWLDAVLYDLTLNTDTYDEATAADLIVAAIKAHG